MSAPAPPHVARVLERLAGVHRSGSGWSAQCLAHEDEHASLSINLGENGRVLLCCHAGCTAEQVCKALGLKLADLFADARARRKSTAPRSRFEAAYRYRDETGKELYQVIRYRYPKDFRVCRRLPGGGTEWKLGNVRRVLYRLPELLAADPADPVFICEGERDADKVAALGLVATTGIGGAGKWRSGDYNDHLRGRHVIILPDNDKAGEAHALDVAWQLYGAAASIKILRLPRLPDKGDVSDWLAAGGTCEQLLSLAAETPLHEPDEPPEPTPRDDDDGGPPKVKVADSLLRLTECAELLHTPGGDGEAHVTVPVGEHRETYRVRSSAFRRWLLKRFYESEGRAPHAQALLDALGVLIARAMFDGLELPVSLRCAAHDGAFWVDLGDAEWRAVKVKPNGWEVIEDPPVRFLRPKGMLPLPAPEHGGSVDGLREFVNVPNDEDWALLLAWLVAALRPLGPYPILMLNGEAGSAKSTTCRIVRSLIDPNSAPLRSEPRETRDLFIAANNARVVCFDNLSTIRPGLSDDLCRLATGGGFATRELYSDAEEVVFDSMRPIIINGIDDLASRGDLADRAIVLILPPIHEKARRTEQDLWAAFERVRPLILGALLEAVGCVMKRLPTIKLPSLPRMADFATWSVAAEPAFGLAPGAFMAAYTGNRESANDTAIESSPIGPAVKGLMDRRIRWSGTACELLTELSDHHTDEKTRKRKDWPGTPKGLSSALRRITPNLRASGLEVTFAGPTGRRNRHLIVLERAGAECVASIASIAKPPDGPENADATRHVRTDATRSSESIAANVSHKNGHSAPEMVVATRAIRATGSSRTHSNNDDDPPPDTLANLIDEGAFDAPDDNGNRADGFGLWNDDDETGQRWARS